MNGRTGIFGAALVGLITVISTRFNDILAHAALLWPSICIAAALVSLLFSWGWTQAFKFFCVDVNLNVPPDTTGMTSVAEMVTMRTAWENQVKRAKRDIYGVSMVLCFLPAQAFMCVLWLFPLDRTWLVVFIILWVTCTLAWAAASPFLWKQFFEGFWPWMLMREKRHD